MLEPDANCSDRYPCGELTVLTVSSGTVRAIDIVASVACIAPNLTVRAALRLTVVASIFSALVAIAHLRRAVLLASSGATDCRDC